MNALGHCVGFELRQAWRSRSLTLGRRLARTALHLKAGGLSDRILRLLNAAPLGRSRRRASWQVASNHGVRLAQEGSLPRCCQCAGAGTGACGYGGCRAPVWSQPRRTSRMRGRSHCSPVLVERAAQDQRDDAADASNGRAQPKPCRAHACREGRARDSIEQREHPCATDVLVRPARAGRRA